MIVQARTQCGTVVASQPIAIGSCTLFFHSNFNYELEKLANKDQKGFSLSNHFYKDFLFGFIFVLYIFSMTTLIPFIL